MCFCQLPTCVLHSYNLQTTLTHHHQANHDPLRRKWTLNKLTDSLYGFRTERSCETQIMNFTQELVKGQQYDVNIMYFSKAFNCVLHHHLHCKAEYYGVKGEVHSWLSSFLKQDTVNTCGCRSLKVVWCGILCCSRNHVRPCLIPTFHQQPPQYHHQLLQTLCWWPGSIPWYQGSIWCGKLTRHGQLSRVREELGNAISHR